MNGLAPLKAYCDKGDRNWRIDAYDRSNLDFALDSWLRAICLAHATGTGGVNAYQRRRYTWISDQEVAIGGTANADECCHRFFSPALPRPSACCTGSRKLKHRVEGDAAILVGASEVFLSRQSEECLCRQLPVQTIGDPPCSRATEWSKQPRKVF